jgi:hypothetical protein
MSDNHPSGLILPPGMSSPASPGPDFLDREYGGVHQRSETAQGDILDSEILQLEALFENMLVRYSAKAFDKDEFEREAKERVHNQLGLAITISWKLEYDPVARVFTGRQIPDISIAGRVEKKGFDHDQKVHEITRDILELGPSGVIKSEDIPVRGGHQH